MKYSLPLIKEEDKIHTAPTKTPPPFQGGGWVGVKTKPNIFLILPEFQPSHLLVDNFPLR